MRAVVVLTTALLVIAIGTDGAQARPESSPRAADAGSCADPASNQAPTRPDASGHTVLFDQFIHPLVETATSRRTRLANADPLYAHRVDPNLNAQRINVAMLGYGEEHDQAYDDMGVSVTILSLNLDTWDVASVSLSRDIRAPELEDQSAHEPPRWPLTLRAAYKAVGFDGIRPILEEATGLAIDLQVVMKDVFLRNYLNDVSGPVDLIVPKDLHTNVYRLDGTVHDEDFIPAGLQTLSTDKAMTFVLGEEMDPQGKVDESAALPDDHGIADNPLVKAEMNMGSLAPYMLIPIGGNPYAADLVNDYWGSVRALVKAKLV